MPQPVAVVAPPLTMVAKAVAVAPTWTDRLDGSTAAARSACASPAKTRNSTLEQIHRREMAIRSSWRSGTRASDQAYRTGGVDEVPGAHDTLFSCWPAFGPHRSRVSRP